MPTILINTNLNHLTSEHETGTDTAAKSSSSDLDDEFRQDLNTIITKLLNKSKTVSSRFMCFSFKTRTL